MAKYKFQIVKYKHKFWDINLFCDTRPLIMFVIIYHTFVFF